MILKTMSSATTSDAPLSMLAMSLMEADEAPETVVRTSEVRVQDDILHQHEHHHKHQEQGYGWLSFVFYFLVLALIFYFLYFALRPSFVLKNDDCSDSRSYSEDHYREIDNGKLLGAAVLSALVLIFIMWVFSCLVKL